MRKVIVPAALVLALLAVAGGVLWWRACSPSSRPPQAPAPRAPAAEPELSLSVNGMMHATIAPGTPLVFELVLWNRAARRAAVPAIIVTVSADRFVFHEVTLDRRSAAPSPWRPRLIEPAAPTLKTLDETEVARALFVLGPDATRAIAKRSYRIRVVFEAKPPGSWRGTTVSNDVVIAVGDEKPNDLAFADYDLAIKDYRAAIESAKRALVAAPHSIDASLLLGTAYEAEGDDRAALSAYQAAYREFFVKHGARGDRTLWALKEHVRRMERKLGLEPPEVVDAAP